MSESQRNSITDDYQDHETAVKLIAVEMKISEKQARRIIEDALGHFCLRMGMSKKWIIHIPMIGKLIPDGRSHRYIHKRAIMAEKFLPQLRKKGPSYKKRMTWKKKRNPGKGKLAAYVKKIRMEKE